MEKIFNCFVIHLLFFAHCALGASNEEDLNALIFIENPHFQVNAAAGWSTVNTERTLLPYEETNKGTTTVDTCLALPLANPQQWGELKYRRRLTVPAGTPVYLVMEFCLLDLNKAFKSEELEGESCAIRIKVQYMGRELFRYELSSKYEEKVWKKFATAAPGVVGDDVGRDKELLVYVGFKPTRIGLAFVINYLQLAADPKLLMSQGARRFEF